MAIYRRNRQRKSIYKKGFLQSHGLQKARPKKFPFSIGLVRNRFRSRALFNIVRDAENLSKIKFRKGYEERYLIGKARLAVRIQNNAQLLVKSKRGSKAPSGGKRAAEQNDKPRHKQSVSIGKKRLKKSSGLWIIPKEDGFGYATLYSHHNYVPAFRSRRWRWLPKADRGRGWRRRRADKLSRFFADNPRYRPGSYVPRYLFRKLLLRSPPSKHIDPSYFKTVRRIGGSYFVVLAELDCYGYFRRQARFWARFKGTRRPHGSLDAAFALSELRRSPFRDFDTVTGFDGRAPYPFSGYGRASTFQTAYFIGEGYSRPRGLPRRDYNPDNVQTKFLSVQHSQSRHARRKNKLIGWMPSGHVIAYLTKVADKKLNRGVFKVSPHPSSSLIEDQESLIGLSRTKTDIAAALHRLLPPKAGGSSNARAATARLKSSNSTDYAARRVGNKFSNSIKALKTRKSGKTDVARAAFRTIRARARGTRRPRPGENADKALIRAPRRRIPSLAWQRRAGPVPYQNPVSLSSVHTRFKRRFRAQLGYNNFFRNVKIESFIKGLFAVAVHHASRVALRRWKRGHKTLKRKELRKVIAARLAPNVPAAKALTRRERDQRSYRVFSHLRSIVLRRIISSLSTSYTFARVNSPFASGGHFLWLDSIIRSNRQRLFRSKLFRKFPLNLFRSFFASRHIFLNWGNAKAVLYSSRLSSFYKHFFMWYDYLYRLDKRLMARRASFFRYRRLAKRRPLSRRGIFVLRRDAKQAAEFAISMCENRPFWKINASLRPGGGRRSISVWDYRLRLVVKKYFNYENDPFFGSSFKKSTPVDADVSPFSVFNNLSSRAVVAKGVARAFYSRSIVAFKNDFERGRGGKKFARSWKFYNAQLNPDDNYFVALRYFLSTMSREYRNLLADFSFTLTGAGSIRIFLKKKTPEGETPPRRHDERRPFKARRGVSVSSGLNGAVERSPVKQYAYSLSRDFYAKFQYAWPGSSDTKYFGFQARPLWDGRAHRLFIKLSSLPRSYSFTADSAKSNFTLRYITNAAALAKMFADSCSLLDASRDHSARAGQITIQRVNKFAAAYVSGQKVLSDDLSRINWVAAYRRAWFATRIGRGSRQSREHYYYYFMTSPAYRRMKHRYGLGAAKILHRAAIAVWKFRAAGRKLDGKSVSLEFLNTLATERTAGDSSSARLFSESFEYVYKIFSDLLKRVVYKAFLRRNLWKSKIAARWPRNIIDKVYSQVYRLPGGPERFNKKPPIMVFYPELTRSTIWVRICSRVAHLVLQKALLSKQYYSIRIKRLRSRGLSGATVFDPLAGALLSNSRYNAGFSLGSTISKSIVDRVYGATEFAGTPTMRKNLVFMRGDYFREYVLSRRVSDQLSAGMRKWSVAKSDLFWNNETIFDSQFKKRVKPPFLLKINPDSGGRSRIFYYQQKKARWLIRAFRSYKFIKIVQPYIGADTRRLGENARNAHMRRIRMERGKLKNNLRLKMYLRHIFKRYYQYRSTKLFRKWRAVRQNSLKWLSFYKTFEGSLHRFLRNVRLLPSSIEAKGAIETGLITVNGTVCVNPWYVVRSGDIVMLNSEAYRSIMARRISKLISECLPSDLPSVSRKRLLLAMALKKIRRGYAKGLATIATRLAEQEALEQLIGLFGEDKNYAKIKKKKLAAGGPRIGKDDIYVSDVSEFGLRLKEVYGGNRARLKQRLSNLQKFLDDSRAENGKFYYRFQNAVYVIRAPNSCRELFSVSKQERRPFYNPRTINFFLSHRFWH